MSRNRENIKMIRNKQVVFPCKPPDHSAPFRSSFMNMQIYLLCAWFLWIHCLVRAAQLLGASHWLIVLTVFFLLFSHLFLCFQFHISVLSSVFVLLKGSFRSLQVTQFSTFFHFCHPSLPQWRKRESSVCHRWTVLPWRGSAGYSIKLPCRL